MLLLEDRRFYVYALLDPTKSDNYKYGDYEFEFLPFYIDKGHGNRVYRSVKEYESSPFKYNKIKKLKKNGFKPIMLKYIEYLTESEAFNFEADMIKNIGRRDKKLGPLTNLTNGGKGKSGCISSQETIEKIRKIHIGRKHINRKRLSEEHKEKLRNKHKGVKSYWYGKHHNDETKKKISEAHKKLHSINPALSQRMKQYNANKIISEETRLKYSKALKRRWEDPIQRSKFEKMNLGRYHNEETKKKMSESKMRDKNPNFGKHLSDEQKKKKKKENIRKT